MQYLQWFLQYATLYAVEAIGATVLLITLVAAVNLIYNVYRPINRGLKNSVGKLRNGNRDNWAAFYDSLPKQYKLLWKCYTATGGGVYADRAIGFVEIRQKLLLKGCVALSLAVAVVYAVAFYMGYGSMEFLYAAMAVVFYCLTVLLCVKFSVIAKRRKAERIYSHWTACVDGFFGKDYDFSLNRRVTDEDVSRVTHAVTAGKDTGRVAEILRNSNLEGQRSVEQQRKLNRALNSLVCGANK